MESTAPYTNEFTPLPTEPTQGTQDQPHNHQYPTRRSMGAPMAAPQGLNMSAVGRYHNPADVPIASFENPPPQSPKHVAFELHLDGSSTYRARLPMRVQIFPHDKTDSIVTTVKNFYGIYEGGVSFEDGHGNTLIAHYENFHNNMVVYVRVIADHSSQAESQPPHQYGAPLNAGPLDDVPQLRPTQPAQILNYGQPPSRPISRASRKQSQSPKLGKTSQKSRSRSAAKSNTSSFQKQLDELNSDAVNGYSSEDGGAGSVTSSRKARSEQLASAEISVDNIVAGNRRKRAKFESSELPLFVPPQVPAPNSISSISPQRRTNGLDTASPFARPTPKPYNFAQPMQSPGSFGQIDARVGNPTQAGTFAVPTMGGHRQLRDRTSGSYFSARLSGGSSSRPSGVGIMPTPDPTIASCISDEDVALQLMRLGDASNISHGRTSASTLDDAFSGRADAASSATSDSGDESDTTEQPPLPHKHDSTGLGLTLSPSKKQRLIIPEHPQSFDGSEPSGDDADQDYEDRREEYLRSEADDPVDGLNNRKMPRGPRSKSGKATSIKGRSGSGTATMKPLKAKAPTTSGPISKKAKTSMGAIATQSGFQQPMSPASLTPQSRKTSMASTLNFQHTLGVDEDDLSSKPRCQRCRKSKKGCDRQRPCQRCKDAGIGIEGCVSEEEGNGRKGRYGRHMGVTVKKTESVNGSVDEEYSKGSGAVMIAPAGGANSGTGVIGSIEMSMAGGVGGVQGAADKGKKRKR
ncbi:hypothetical protein MMC25_002631 [Agyrium rufum]|nr:hypothetical protein [Agyrium rufum]